MENHNKYTFPREDNEVEWQDTFQPRHQQAGRSEK